MMLKRSWPKWLILCLIVAGSLHVAIMDFGLFSYVQNWGGVAFKVLSGAALGWGVSRYIIGLDLSDLPAADRPVAALSQAILIGAFALGMATGA